MSNHVAVLAKRINQRPQNGLLDQFAKYIVHAA